MSDAPQDRGTNAFHAVAPALAAAVLALALYSVTLWGTYVYDDLFIVREDPRLHEPGGWRAYWVTDYFLGGVDRLYRPLVSMTYAAQWRIHGDRPWAFHLVNWLLHAGVSAGVAELARRLSGRRAAFAAGLLFAAHPVHVEAVANIVGRAELMCALGSVGALLLLARRPMTTARAAAVLGCYCVALLSKEQGMLLPLLLLALGWVVYRSPPAPGAGRDGLPPAPEPVAPAERRALVALAMAVCWSLAAYVFLRESWIRFTWDRALLDWTVNPLIRSGGADRWLVPLALLGRYAALLVAPWKLSMDYGGRVIPWTQSWADPYLYLGLAALALWAVLFAATVRRRAWAAAFCLLGVGVTYGMVANVLTLIGTVFAERLMYLPSAFFLILAGLGLARLSRRATVPVLVCLLLLGSVRTWTYARRWNDRLALYASAAAEQPGSVQARLLLSDELCDRGQFDRAEQVAAEARALAPDNWEPYYFSARVELARGDLDAAERFAGEALSRKQAMNAIAIMGEIQKRRAAGATR